MLKTFIDLFCGLGGFRLALEAEGLECVFSCDMDEKVMECYKENFGDAFCYTRDIRDIPASFIPDCDVITGGFPCQPWSVAKTHGKRGLDDDRSDLFKEILRIAEVKKPKVLLLENVPGILSSSNNVVVQRIYKGLEDIGYETRYMKLKASYFGVPQARERVYFVAIRKDLNLKYTPPEPVYEPVCIRDVLIDLSPEELDELIVPIENCHIFRGTESGSRQALGRSFETVYGGIYRTTAKRGQDATGQWKYPSRLSGIRRQRGLSHHYCDRRQAERRKKCHIYKITL